MHCDHVIERSPNKNKRKRRFRFAQTESLSAYFLSLKMMNHSNGSTGPNKKIKEVERRMGAQGEVSEHALFLRHDRSVEKTEEERRERRRAK